MQTIFSHIVQKRLSQENENVATEALAFVLRTHEAAHNGMMKLLRRVDLHMPHLWFRTQQTDGKSRPDMQGCDDKGQTHVFVENKFWAGLTENQPVSYILKLAECTQPTILLVIGPEDRKETLWRELNQRLADNKISTTKDMVAGIFRITTTSTGPILALTSWKTLLNALELEVADDKLARSDLLQLQALCAAADSDAFLPISSTEVTDQRTPTFIRQLNTIVQDSVELAVTAGVLKKTGFRPQADWERIGRYAMISGEQGVGIWFGIHFGLWKKYGGTPLWLVFLPTEWGRASEVRPLLEPWSAQRSILATSHDDGSFVVAIDIMTGEDKEQVVSEIVNRLKEMADVLSVLKSNPTGNLNNE